MPRGGLVALVSCVLAISACGERMGDTRDPDLITRVQPSNGYAKARDGRVYLTMAGSSAEKVVGIVYRRRGTAVEFDLLVESTPILSADIIGSCVSAELPDDLRAAQVVRPRHRNSVLARNGLRRPDELRKACPEVPLKRRKTGRRFPQAGPA